MDYSFALQHYPVILEEDESGGYVATCPAFDGCYSQGETLEEALTHIKEAIQLCLEEARERGDATKVMSRQMGLHMVTV